MRANPTGRSGSGGDAWAFRAPHPTVVAALLNATGRILPFRGVGH